LDLAIVVQVQLGTPSLQSVARQLY